MANTLSDLMANAAASPAVMNDPRLSHGRVRTKVAVVSVAAADSDGHIYPVARFKASDVILSIEFANTAITGGTDYEIGLYESGDWGLADQTAKDIDVYLGTLTMATGRAVWTDGMTALAATTLGKPIWTDAGDAAAPTPGTEYDLAITANTVGTLAGTILVKVLYTSGD